MAVVTTSVAFGCSSVLKNCRQATISSRSFWLFSFAIDPINVFRETASRLGDGCGICFFLFPACFFGIELPNFVVSALVLAAFA